MTTVICSLAAYFLVVFVSLPHAAMSWSAVCNCGISWSYSLIFYVAYIANTILVFASMTKASLKSTLIFAADVQIRSHFQGINSSSCPNGKSKKIYSKICQLILEIIMGTQSCKHWQDPDQKQYISQKMICLFVCLF